jgi:NADPH2:quinone reductase
VGDAHALKIENDYPTPQLKPGHVIVKNEYAGVNFIDTYHRKGLYPRDLPFVGGQEGGGTVVAVSDEAPCEGIQVDGG